MRKTVKYPCRSCLYFDSCGDNMRTQFCGGRYTKRQKEADVKHANYSMQKKPGDILVDCNDDSEGGKLI